MKYANSTGREHARRRKQKRSNIVLGVVGAVVVLGGGYAVGYASGVVPGSRPPEKPASCTPSEPNHPNSGFTVNVYNASKGQGRAKSVAGALKSKHFDVAVVSNDPYAMKLSDAGQLRFGPKGEALAKKYLQPLFPNAEFMKDGRDDSSVDVVLGDQSPAVQSDPPVEVTTPPGC